jgi:hypothetical protein
VDVDAWLHALENHHVMDVQKDTTGAEILAHASVIFYSKKNT